MANSKQFILDLFPDNNNNEITASDIRTFVTAVFDEEVDINEIQDNLISSTTNQPLSANQGRILNDKITANTVLVGTKEDSLGVGTEGQILKMILGIKTWTTEPIVTQTVIRDDLLSITTDEALSANQGRVLDGKISTLSTDVQSYGTQVSQNTADIATNVTAIGTNATDIAATVLATSTNATNISSNLTLIGTNTAGIAANVGAISALDTRTSQNEIDITAANAGIAANAADITTANAGISANVTDIGTNAADILALDTAYTIDVANLTSRVDAAEVSVGTNRTDIDSNDVDIAAIDARVTAAEGNITTNDADIAGTVSRLNIVEPTVAQNTTNIGTNVTNITALDVRVTAAEGDIATRDLDIANNTAAHQQNTADILTNTGDISTLQTVSGTNTTNITALDVRVTTAEGNIATNDTDIENNRLNIVANDTDITALEAKDLDLDNDIALLNIAVGTKEDVLGVPTEDGYVLGSLIDGTRVWYPNERSSKDFIVIDDVISADPDNALSANQGKLLQDQVDLKETKFENPLVTMPAAQTAGLYVLTANITDPTEVGGRVVDYTYDWQETGIGLLSNLTTTAKTSIVDAINSIDLEVSDTAHSHGNKAVLDATEASYTLIDEAKVDNISVSALVDLDALSAEAAANTIQVGTNTTNIGVLQTDLGTLETRVGLDDLSGISLRVATNETDIGTANTNIGINAGNISTNAGNISTNTGNIGSLTTQQGLNTTQIETNRTDILTKEPNLPSDTGLGGYFLSTDGVGTRSWLPVAASSDTDRFQDLTDTPSDFIGHANKIVAVNVGEAALEFVTFDRSYLNISSTESIGFYYSQDPKTWLINTATQTELTTLTNTKFDEVAPLITPVPVQTAGTLVLTAIVTDATDAGGGYVTDYDYGWQETGIGTLSSLTTTAKTDLVSAVNELDTDSHTHANKEVLDATEASYTLIDEAKVDNISVSTLVDLDVMESQIATNVTNIGTNSTNIGTNTTNIGNNATAIALKADKAQTSTTSTVYTDKTTGTNYKLYVDNGSLVLEEIV